MQDGKIVVNPLAEGMTDPKLTTLSGQRSFIGYTPDNHLLMGTVPNVTLPQLAEICQAMGMTAAMNLDGGASSGLYAHGKLLTRPGRELSNAIVVATRKTEPIQVKWGERQLAFTRGPLLIQGSLYVPAVEILEQLGAQVAVQQQEKELLATWQGKEFRLSERGRLSSSADGTVSHVPTRKIGGVQMVSLRSIVEVLGMRVEWDPQARTAVIFSQSSGIK